MRAGSGLGSLGFLVSLVALEVPDVAAATALRVGASSSSRHPVVPHTPVYPVLSCHKNCTGDQNCPPHGRNRAGY